MRQKILFCSKESGSGTISYDEKLVEGQFKHSICTGVRDEAIRNDLRTVLEKYKTDENLIEEVNKLVRLQEEINTKFKLKKVSKLSAEESTETLENQIIKELKALRAEVNVLKNNADSKSEYQAAD